MDLNIELERIAKAKGIETQVLTEAIEEAILAAAKKTFGMERNLFTQFNEENGSVELFQKIKAVSVVTDTFNERSLEELKSKGIGIDEESGEFLLEEGVEMDFDIYYLDKDAEFAKEQDAEYGDILKLETSRKSFGRIAAQTVKHVIVQRIKDAERGRVFNEYSGRKHDLVTGIVRRFERGNLIVDLGRAEAILPLREQIPRENYRTADRIQAWVKEVNPYARGPQILLSRTAPEFLIKLFELEVPEVAEGVVAIEGASRDPGSRAKIAVSSSDMDVDPVGACVGMKGVRVQAVVQELRGEKIDIVPFSEDTATFVCNALQPAEVSRVLIDEANRKMEIIVPDDQLSLAIGRRGQNVRLASKLTRWHLDIHSETRINDIKSRAWESLKRVEGMNEFVIQTLYNHGIRSASDLAESDAHFLNQIPGVSPELVQTILVSSKEVAALEIKEIEERKEKEGQERDARRTAEDYTYWLTLDNVGRLKEVRGMGDTSLGTLTEKGVGTVEALASSEVAALSGEGGLTAQKSKQLIYGAKQRLEFEKELKEKVITYKLEEVEGVYKTPTMIKEEKEEQERILLEEREAEERLRAMQEEAAAAASSVEATDAPETEASLADEALKEGNEESKETQKDS